MTTRYDALQGMRILVVEDETLIAMEIEQILQDLRCDIVGTVSTIEDALAAIRQHPLDGTLLDSNLHGRTSSPVAQALIDRAVPFLLVTGYGNKGIELPVFRTATRVAKPFGLEELADPMMEAFVGRPAQG